MAFIHGIGTGLEGSAGEWTYYRQFGKEIAKQKNGPNKSKSKKQLDQRSQIANPCNVWLSFDKKLKPSFEEEKRKPGQSNFSAFISRGMLAFKVYLSKELARFKGCVAAPYMIGEGSLPTIETEKQGEMLVSSLCLGDLQIGASTKVADLFIALYRNNKGRFEMGDQLQFYRVAQLVDQVGEVQVPRVRTYATRVVIDLSDDRTLYAAAGNDGFASTRKADGRYYLSADIKANTLVAWMQSRLTDDNKTLVSTQTLVGDNSVLKQYTGARAMYEAAKSYGPAKEEDYVTPGSTNEEDMIEELIKEYEQTHGGASTPGTGSGTGNTDPTPGEGSGEGEQQPGQGEQPGGGNQQPEEGGTGQQPGQGGSGSEGEGPDAEGKVLVTVTGDITNNVEYIGSGRYTPGTEVQIWAKILPSAGSLVFDGWNDGNNSNPRTITVPNRNTTYTASFSLSARR